MAVGDPQPDLLRTTFENNPAPAGQSVGPDKPAPQPPEPDVIKLSPDKWSDALAMRIVVFDFERAQAARRVNFDQRWDESDRLLHANLIQRIWEGTPIPRSSLGIKLSWQQVESLLPHLMSSIFTSVDGIWFETFPRPGTSIDQALMTRELMSAQLDEADVWEVTRRVLKSALVYGTGVMKTGWKREERNRAIWEDKLVPKVRRVRGLQMAIGHERQFARKEVKAEINRPELSYVSVRDFYIDPSHKLPQIKGAGFVVHRSMVTLEDLQRMADDDESIKLPPREQMIEQIKTGATPSRADADTHKRRSAVEQDIREDYPLKGSTDPARAKFELLEYWTEDRLVTVLNRHSFGRPIRNIPNPYGFIPFIAVNYTDVLDQFYGKGIPEIIEGEQKLQQGLLNAHIDETSLSIHGALVIEAGTVLNKQQLRRRPGQIIEATRTDSIKQLEMKPVTQDAFVALQQSQLRAQQYTGVSDLVSLGTPSVRTSATRTAAGVAAVSGAATNRIQYMIQNAENNLMVPLLDHVIKLNQLFLDPSQMLAILGQKGMQVVNPMQVTNGEYKFELRASSRMTARQAMQQSLPFLLQTLMNPELSASLQQQQQKLNIMAVVRDVMDVMNWRSRNDWFVPMTPEDLQRQQLQQMQAQQQQLQQLAAQSDRDRQRIMDKAISTIAVTTFEKALEGKPAAAAALGSALDAAGAGNVAGMSQPGQ